MKARRKGNDEWQEVKYVQLEGQEWYLISAEDIEFQHDTLSTELKTYDQVDMEKHWQDVRERAAIAIMAGIIANSDPRLSLEPDANKLAKGVIKFADALVKQLKEE